MSGEIGVESMETRGKNDYFEERPTKRKKVDSELLLRELKTYPSAITPSG